MIKVADLKLNPRNPRRIAPAKLEKLKKSLTEFSKMMELRPLVVDEAGVVLGGNMRLQAAAALGMTELPDAWVKRADDLTDAEKREFIIKDNAAFGDWDFEILAADWTADELNDWAIDLPADFGTDPNAEPKDAEPQIDRAAELNEKWKVESGDLWRIGEHRLLCGDSTKREDVERLMQGEVAVLMNTDPPYGVDYVNNAKSKGQAGGFNDIANDELNGKVLQDFLEATIKAALPNLLPNTAFYLWHPMLTQGTFFAAAAAAAAADILIHRQIIWVKPTLVFGRGDYHWRHELCFYGWIRGNRPAFYGQRNQTTIWEAGREGDGKHPTQKPIELFIRPIRNHTKQNDVIYESFGGSGSQLVAAENLKRKCYAIEISPNYCAVILERMATAFPQITIGKLATNNTNNTN